MSRKTWWLDSLGVFALAAVLVLPLFRLEYLDNWKSIEGAFMADARALQENWPHHLWQPLEYCGTRADYWYPPGHHEIRMVFEAPAEVIGGRIAGVAALLLIAFLMIRPGGAAALAILTE